MDKSQQIFEFRGVDSFYYAEVLQDDADGYLCGTPVHIPVQEVGKNVDAASEAHYYDNKAMIVVNSESADTISLVLAPPELKKLAHMTGKSFDPVTGMMVDSPRQNKYFAIMYRTKGTDGNYRYVSRLKGQFNIPEETVQTEDDGTDTSNTTIEFTGIYTEHEFTKGIYDGSNWSPAGVKGIVVDERYGLANVSNFFAQVQTPDSISAAGTVNVTGVSLAPSTLNFTELNDTAALTATVTPASATDKSVTFTSSADAVAEVSEEGVVTAKSNGTAIITVTTTDGGFTDVCAVVVNAE
ncbi:MAG: Ig-like domain-containing protein [Lachnospiraceae bacterium]|nr:Ig-like domain-containing protein [Lachnospiraceae bacterium]